MSDALARVLVADDEADLRALLQRYLNPARAARCAPSMAARRWRSSSPRERFDVLVLDIMMPGEDGLSICRRLRAKGKRSRSSC